MWLDGSFYVSLDTEFIASNLTRTGLISIGLATENDRFYAVNADMDTTMAGLPPESTEWMLANVWPHLPGRSPENFDRSHPDVMPYEAIASGVEEFFNKVETEVDYLHDRVVLFAHCGAQDMVRLHTLWDNDWSRMPNSVPNWFRDVKDMRLSARLTHEQLPEQPEETRHHSLLDAFHELDVVRRIVESDPQREGGLV